MKNLKILLLLLVLSISTYSYSNMESNYRRSVRDAKTRMIMQNDTSYKDKTTLIVSIGFIVFVFIVFNITSKNKQKHQQKINNDKLYNIINRFARELKITYDDLMDCINNGKCNFNYELTDDSINNLKLIMVEINSINKYSVDNFINTKNVLTAIVEDIEKNISNTKLKERQNTILLKYGEDKGNKILNQQFQLGWTMLDILESKRCEPTTKETEVMATKTKEIWIYGNKSSGDTFTFVNGLLERFKDR